MEGSYPDYIVEKIKLNNQIVLMRKHVKQAKVHSINKLSKEVKLLQNRKGDEIRVMKAKRKAERYLQEISLLKKMKPDCVSKLALSKAKNWKEILSQKNSTLEDRCIAVLASYGPVQKEVELFCNSNKDLVPKIPKLLEQWESKSKFPKNSYQKKNANLQNNTNHLKIKAKESLLNMTNQSESTDNDNNKSLKEKTNSNLLIKNDLDLKCNEKKNVVSLKQKLSTSLKPSQNSFLTDNKCNKSNNEYLKENETKIKISDKTENKPKNLLSNNKSELEMEQTNTSADSETKIDCESNNENKTEDESDMENDKSEDEDADFNIFLDNKSKSECTEFKDTDSKNLKKSLYSESNDCAGIEKNSVAENVTSSCLVPAKTDNRGSKSGENKLKAIAMINLDDFRDLDEIPVDNSIQNTESSEEEEGANDDSSNTQNDPFFLGRDEAVSAENKLVDDLKSNNFVSVNEIFERKEKSNDNNYTRNFHKPLNSSRFHSKYSPESKGEKNFKTWKKDKIMHNCHQDRFQHKRKHTFDSEDPGYKHQSFNQKNIDRYKNNKKEFTQRASFESYGYTKQKYSKDLDHRKGDKFSASGKDLHKKSDESCKPLHPSWEAKRKQKEMTNMSFQGKKIVFED